MIAQGKLAPAVTTPLVFEYQMVLGRSGLLPSEFSSEDLVLEAAFSSKSGYIVTFNQRHFRGAVELGIVVISPVSFLRHLVR